LRRACRRQLDEREAVRYGQGIEACTAGANAKVCPGWEAVSW